MLFIDINCDMGEGADDASLMPFISSANIACGYHAGDEDTIKKTINLAMRHNVSIGAHPGFNDKRDFGRKELALSDREYYDLVTNQLEIIKKIADETDAKLHHVKPHGAFYNLSAKDPAIARVIAEAIRNFDKTLIVYGLSGSYSISEAAKLRLQTANEAFADRTYRSDGSLTPRSQAYALIEDEIQCRNQVSEIIQERCVTTIDNKKIPLTAETICIHGDGKNAYRFAKAIYTYLESRNIYIKAY